MQVRFNTERFVQQVAEMCEVGLDKAADIVLAEEERELSQHGTGRIYPGGHQASAPGEPPAPNTGWLLQSLNIESQTLTRKIGTDVPYGAILETGSSGAHRMAPRPWLLPAYRNARKAFMAAFQRELH